MIELICWFVKTFPSEMKTFPMSEPIQETQIDFLGKALLIINWKNYTGETVKM